MNSKKACFPYPMLGIGDSVSPALNADCIKVSCKKDDPEVFKFTIILSFENDEIKDYISKGFAKYTFEINCPKTLYRCCHFSEVPYLEIAIPRKSLNKEVTFNCYVTACKPILDYQISGVHERYQGFVIDIQEGEILVAFPECGYPVNLDIRNMRSPTTLMQVRRTEGLDFTSFDIKGDKIIIKMPDSLFDVYHNLSEEKKETIMAPLIVNAMTCALFNFDKYKDSNWDWVLAVKYRLTLFQNLGFDLDDITFDDEEERNRRELDTFQKYAQAILSDPYKDLIDMVVGKKK